MIRWQKSAIWKEQRIRKSEFTGKMRFHNLLPAELGAVLWALEWGGRPNLRHALGMGRSFGFGQVTLQVISDVQKNVIPNCKEGTTGDKKNYITAFICLMELAYRERKEHLDQSWEQSEQLLHLLAMADQEKVNNRPLKHMTMGMHGTNDFVNAKQAGLVLPPYIETSASSLSPKIVEKVPTQKKTGIDVESICHWVDETIQKLVKRLKTKHDLVLRGITLAERWQSIDDPELKKQAFQEIDRRWKNQALWDQPGKSLKKAKAIYLEHPPKG